MKKFTLLLLAVLIAVNFNSCSKDEGNVQSTNYEAEIIDYNIEVKEPNTIYQVRDYVNLITKEEIIVYGNYNENLVLDKITQIVYQNTESHLEFSFDRNGVLTTITNYDLSSNTINDKVYIKEENSKFYLSRNNETIELQKGGDVQFQLLSDDVIGSKINSVLNNNALLFSHLNGSDGLAKSTVGEQKAQGILPLIVAGVAIYTVVKFIQNNGIYQITKGTQIESNNIEELYQNCRNAVSNKTNSKSSSTNYSNYSCNSNIAPIRENNHNLNLSFCGTRICVIEEPFDCNTSTLAMTISDPVIFNDVATVTAKGIGGVGKYNYKWSDGQVGENASFFKGGTYSVTVTDGNGCSISSSVVIKISCDLNTILGSWNVEMYNTCYPNPDGTPAYYTTCTLTLYQGGKSMFTYYDGTQAPGTYTYNSDCTFTYDNIAWCSRPSVYSPSSPYYGELSSCGCLSLKHIKQ